VYGLIFLYEYRGEDSVTGVPGTDIDVNGKVWFANQTVDNACASVALLNILMNSDINVGDELRQFKEETLPLSCQLRGWKLGTDATIRSAHNYLVRRMDCLNADLYLDNAAANARRVARSKRRAIVRKKLPEGHHRPSPSDAAYHFIAYVESSGYVWELNGLHSRPVCLGAVPDPIGCETDASRWISKAVDRMQQRIQEYDGSMGFNLLALCKSPLSTLSGTIARAVKSIRVLDARMREVDERQWEALVPAKSMETGVTCGQLQDDMLVALGGLTAANIAEAEVLDARLVEDVDSAGLPTKIREKKTSDEALFKISNHDALAVTDTTSLEVVLRTDMGETTSPLSSADSPNVTSRSTTAESAIQSSPLRTSFRPVGSPPRVTNSSPRPLALAIKDALILYDKFTTMLDCARGELATREEVAQENVARVDGRKQNWLPAIHAWLWALAENGELEKLVDEARN
jgi:hypothetical protein